MPKLKKKKSIIDYKWIFKIAIISFIISVVFSLISETSIPNVSVLVGILLTLIFIGIGILFDMVGVAVTVADESKFHSMASQKVKGSKMAIRLTRNADKVSSFCNDVVGDIAGIISGSTGAVISIKMSNLFNLNSLLITLLVMGIISTLTISGKAIGKGIAISKADKILFKFAKLLNIFVRS